MCRLALGSREQLPSPNPWSMSTWSCGLQSQRQLHVTLAITLPLHHWLQKLARFPHSHGPARLWHASDFHPHLSPLFKGEMSPGGRDVLNTYVPSTVQPSA